MNDDLLPDLLAAIDQQLDSVETPYVGKTLARLVALGLEESEAKTQMALTIGEQIDHMHETGKPFDEKAYKTALDALPFEEEGAG
jgi:hypothetical protein